MRLLNYLLKIRDLFVQFFAKIHVNMANNNKKIGVSKKKPSANKSSNQKENRPKKVKPFKPNPNDSICLSKQLQMKKTSQNNKRTQKLSVRNDTKRFDTNGKRMPSLAELEKMYEDSDTDEEKDNNTTNTNIRQLSTPQLNTPTVVTPDQMFSPSTRNKISQQVKELLKNSDCNDDDVSRPPPIKKLKFDTTCDNSSPVTSTSNNKKIANSPIDSLVSINDPLDLLCIYTPAGSNPDHNQNEPKIINDTEVPNEYSSDNNKTLELTEDGQFSPKPSTSKNNEILNENHKLFIKSLKYRSTNETTNEHPKNEEQNLPVPICPETPETDTNITPSNNKEQDFSIPILPDFLETDTNFSSTNETNVLPANYRLEDDELIIEEPNIVKIETDSDSQINDCDNDIAADATAEAHPNAENDNDCMIIDNHANDIIDLENESVEDTNTNNDISHMDDEVIDVDALIAQNQSILSKFENSGRNNLDNSNRVVNVEVSTLCDNTNEVTTQNAAAIVSEDLPDVVIETFDNQEPVRSHDMVEPITIPDEVAPLRPPNVFYDNNPANIPISIIDLSIHYARNKTLNRGRNNVNNRHRSNDSRYISPYQRFSSQIDAEQFRFTGSIHSLRVTPRTRISIIQCQQTTTPAHKSTVVPTTTLPTLDSECTPEDSLANLGDCPICMELLAGRVLASTICGHLFCLSCIQQAVKTTKRCPKCRKLLKNKGYHQIFL